MFFFIAILGIFQMGATSQHVHLSLLFTFHAYSSYIYQHITKINPILLFPINLIHEFIDKFMLLGQVIYLNILCY
jgi:hypothetical protein